MVLGRLPIRARALISCVILAVWISCGEPEGLAAANAVTIRDNSFTPQTLTVPAGTLVRWVNSGVAVHDVTQYEGAFLSGAIEPGESFEHRFPVVGRFDYACARHPGMQGTVVVE
jgi:plastocyanin